jgi:hypothetical protein
MKDTICNHDCKKVIIKDVKIFHEVCSIEEVMVTRYFEDIKIHNMADVEIG